MKSAYAAAGIALIVLSVCIGSAWGEAATRPASATTAPAEVGGVGTVNGDNVYVRSGFSATYYPVVKLHKGDKVTVLRSEYGWLEIEPPAGTYSLVEKSRIDKSGASEGTANDVAQVYAAGDLDKRHYAKQVKLSKGEKVKIIGEWAEAPKEGQASEGDFYKIAPPAGATLWISADLVKFGSGATGAKIEPVKNLKAAQAEVGALVAASGDKPKSHVAVAKPVAPAPKPQALLTDENRVTMKAIEAEIAAEMAKPPASRVLEPALGKLAKLAGQDADPVAQAYGKARAEQLQEAVEIAAAINEMKQLQNDAKSQADAIAAERARIRAEKDPWVVNDIVARGEIRVSELYNGGGGKARRWRMVDPKTNRAIAYIQLPAGSPIDPIEYYGKFVGIRATSYELMTGTVPPLPVYVVSEIKVLDPNAPVEKIFRGEALASPPAPVAERPSSQPASEKPAVTQPASASGAAAPVAPNAQ